MGDGKYDVLVYDNNHPGEERRVRFNTDTNTWRYYAATNPGVPSALYEGDAKTRSALLYPSTPGLGINSCPFCLGKSKVDRRYNTLALEGNPRDHAHLIVVDRDGRRTGIVGDRLVNEIPGVKVVRSFSNGLWRDGPEPMYRIPRDTRFHAIVDGGDLSKRDTERVSLLGPGYSASLDEITISPGERARIGLDPRGNRLTYRRSQGTESPQARFDLESRHASLSLEMKAVRADPDSRLRFRNIRSREQLRFSDRVSAPQLYEIDVLNLRQRRKEADRVVGRDLFALPRADGESRPACGTGVGLRVEPAVGGILVFPPAPPAKGECGH